MYGSLRFPEVMRVLLDRVPAYTPAVASGWLVAALPGRPYPALVTASGDAAGLCVDDLSPAEWVVIDAFEDDVYDLRRLSLRDGSHAWAYVCADAAEVLPTAWSCREFSNDHLVAYVARCARWRARLAL